MKAVERPKISEKTSDFKVGTIIWTTKSYESFNDSIWFPCNGAVLDNVDIDYPELFKVFGGESLSAYNVLPEEEKSSQSAVLLANVSKCLSSKFVDDEYEYSFNIPNLLEGGTVTNTSVTSSMFTSQNGQIPNIKGSFPMPLDASESPSRYTTGVMTDSSDLSRNIAKMPATPKGEIYNSSFNANKCKSIYKDGITKNYVSGVKAIALIKVK